MLNMERLTSKWSDPEFGRAQRLGVRRGRASGDAALPGPVDADEAIRDTIGKRCARPPHSRAAGAAVSVRQSMSSGANPEPTALASRCSFVAIPIMVLPPMVLPSSGLCVLCALARVPLREACGIRKTRQTIMT